MKKRITLLALTIILLTLNACGGNAAASVGVDSADLIDTNQVTSTLTSLPETASASKLESASTVPVGWSEATHGNEAEPNYDVVFPADEVNQITINITPENWAAMQANMTELFGEAGSGEGSRGFPGVGGPPVGNRPPPGEDGLPEDFEPPEGDFPVRPEDSTSAENGGRPELPDGAPPGGRARGGGFGGDDMTPENPVWVPATIEFEANTWTNVGVRYKGNSSLTSGWRSGTFKLPLKLDFDEFEDEHPEIENQRFYGFKQLSLANSFKDSSFLRDAATALVLEDADLPAAKNSKF